MTQKNLNKEEVKEIIKEFPLVPSRGKMIVTVNTVKYDEDELEESLESLDEYQYVIAVPENSLYKPGDKVLIDIIKLSAPMQAAHNAYEHNYQIQLDPIKIKDNMFTFVNEKVIKAKDVTNE